MEIFPIIQPELYRGEAEEKITTDIKMEGNEIARKGGAIQLCQGGEAIGAWAKRALRTAKGVHEIYSDTYGSGLEALAGYGVDQADLTEAAEACLRQNKYVDSVSIAEAEQVEEKVTLRASIETIFGEETEIEL